LKIDSQSYLSVKGLSTGYSKKTVLEDVSFHIEEGERVAIVGRNGAGKSTLLMTLVGALKAWKGSINYLGREQIGLGATERVCAGMALVPQGGKVFPNLKVKENLDLGAYVIKDKKAIASSLEFVYEIFPVLRERATQEAGTMSGGERQMLAIGRALMAQPKLLMLDEPSLGLSPLIVSELMGKISYLSDKLKVTVIIVEQNVRATFKIVERVYVLKLGKIVFEEKPEILCNDERLYNAYLT